MKSRTVLVCVALVVAALWCAAPAPAKSKGVGGTFYYYTAENARVTGTQAVWKGWKIGGPGGSTINWNKSYGWANSWSASFGITAGQATACVGFSVTASGSESVGVSWTVPAGKYGWLGYYDNLRVSKFDIVKHIGPGDIRVGVVGTGTAKKHMNFSTLKGYSSGATVQPPAP
jgi:hypothetical protein